ncbi:MAG: heme oxygenase (biliverdin-producing) [Actinomycetota bacterium]
MSDIIARVEENKTRFREKLTEDLATKPLSVLLRRETWTDHERAQFSPFELSLAEGTITKEGYAELVLNVLPVYEALEKRVVELAGDPLVGQFHIDELARVGFLKKDLAYFYPDTLPVDLLPYTQEYVDRIMNVGPIGFIAHHYTRYMADLSGGLMIYGALKQTWGSDDGLAYYNFSAIGDPIGFKNAYRQALNDLPLDVEGKLELIGEVMIAYEYNIEMGKALAQKHLAAAV